MNDLTDAERIRPGARRGRRPVARTAFALGVAAALTATAAVVAPAGAAAPTAPSAQTATPADLAVPELAWQPCGETAPAFECTSVELPTDYANPAGATTTVALTRLPASDPAQRVGSLFTNFGGPGGPGVSTLQLVAEVMVSDEVRAAYDVIGFDPRTVGLSDPATCFATAAEEAAFLATLSPFLFPVTDEQEQASIAENARLGRQCELTSGDRFASSSTANVARDLDLLRQAVGDEDLNYFGYSYGTVLGATYAALFPDHVGRFVLDGTVDVDRWSNTAGEQTSVGVRLGQGPAAAEVFEEFLRLCTVGGPQTCSLAALGDPREVALATFDRLREAPISVPVGDGTSIEVDYTLAVVMAFQALYSPAGFPALADSLAFLAVGGEAGGTPVPAGTPALVAQAQALTGAVTEVPRPRRGEDYTSVGNSLSTLCADMEHPGTAQDYPRFADEADVDPWGFGRFRAWVGVNCETLPSDAADSFQGPWEQTTDAQVMVIGTEFDPATAYDFTQPYADNWDDARVLTVEGWGHTILGVSTCADAAVTSYLLGGEAVDGATCDQDYTPFVDPLPTAPAASAQLGAVRATF